MKIAASLAVAALSFGTACSSTETGTVNSATTIALTTEAPATTAGPTTTTEAATTTLSPEEAVSFEILEQTDQYVSLLIVDGTGRNVAGISVGGAPETLIPRPIYVYIKRATNPDQSLVTDGPVRLQVAGGYHNGGTVMCPYNTVRTAVMCIGFARMDNAKYTLETFDFRDIPNHVVDVSTAIDVLLDNPDLTTPIDAEQIYYFGGSMGGITGSLFAHPDFRDNRIKAVISFVGGIPFWLEPLGEKATFDAGPPILMVNKMKDSIFTYELAKLSFAAAQGSSNVELLSVFEGEHTDFVTCQAVAMYQTAWIDHHVSGGSAPDPSVFDGSDCAAYGPQEGGSTGIGPRADLFPDDIASKFES